MDKLLEQLWDFVAQDSSLSYRVRLFRLMSLILAIVCLFFVLPVNLIFLNDLMVVNVGVVLLGAFGTFCYVQSCRGRHLIELFILVSLGLLIPIWFLNGGSTASINYYFFPAFIYTLVMCRGPKRWLLSALVVLELMTLLTIEYFYPSLTTGFPKRSDLYWDLVTGMVAAFLMIGLVIWVIMTNSDWEQDRLERYAQRLAASEENYRGVVENANSIILRLDREGRITFFNKFAETLFGYDRYEIIGRDALKTIVPPFSSKGEDMAAKFQELLRDPKRHEMVENENLCRDGRRIWVNWTNRPIYNDQGQLCEILCVGADITERAALIEELRLTKSTMDAAAEQIMWTDSQGHIIYANAAAVDHTGYSAEELRQHTLHDLVTDFPVSTWPERWETLQREHSVSLEVLQRLKQGGSLPVELTMTYHQVAAKEITMVFMHDLTARLQAEEKRRQYEMEMQHLQRLESLGLLAGGIAHDFNNLLTAILANISLVKMDLPVTGDHFEQLSEAEKASVQARDLTTQLLTFAKGGKPIKTAVHLERVIRDSSSLALRGQSVKCDLQIASDLLAVEADAGQLTQVFNNLFINACQAMPQGGVLTVSARNQAVIQPDKAYLPAGDYVQVTLQDQGRGISPENLPKIFDPYFTTKKTGAGLGLAVVYSIIKNHGGSISAASTPGVGTMFSLLLPVLRQSDHETEIIAKPISVGGGRILVMDDELMVRKVISKMLAKAGYEVETAADGTTALECYRQAAANKNPFSLVVMDLTIPGGMGGQETIQQLLKMDPNARAIVSSGYSDNPVMADFRAFGFKGVVAKPYAFDQLQATIRRALLA